MPKNETEITQNMVDQYFLATLADGRSVRDNCREQDLCDAFELIQGDITKCRDSLTKNVNNEAVRVEGIRSIFALLGYLLIFSSAMISFPVNSASEGKE